MSDYYYNDLREFIQVLDHQGLLYRWQRLVDKDSELMPLMRDHRVLLEGQRMRAGGQG